MAAGYVVRNTADLSLVANTEATIVNVINSAGGLIRVTALSVSFAGTSSTAEPVLVRLCQCTQATAGTSTSQTPVQIRGATRTVQATGAVNYTVEPTSTAVTIHDWLVHPQSGITIEYPFGREPEQTTTADGLCLSLTAPAVVDARGWIEFEEG